MGEIVVSEVGKVRIEPRRRLMTEVVASCVALALAGSALSVLKQEPPASQALLIPPIVDRSTGKIVDRFGEKGGTEIAASRPALSSVALFAPGVDLGPAMTALVAHAERQDTAVRLVQVAAQDAPAPAVPRASAKSRGTPPRASVKTVVVAEAAPLPPIRPESFEPAPAQALVAEASTKDPSGLFGWRLPAEILPTSQKVLKQVASLSGAVLDRLTP